MSYQYSGLLKTLLDPPDPATLDALDAIVFTAEDLARWNIEEQDKQREWDHIPVRRTRKQNAIHLEGNFEKIQRLDLGSEAPRFWVSLSTLGKRDARFPVDLERYPIVEVTYRCVTPKARPAWLWTYPGGAHLAWLTPTEEWRTAARRIPHRGFPQQVESLTFRVYATARTAEAIEIESVRFRALSPAETEAVARAEAQLERLKPPPAYPVMDEFLPLGTFTNAGTARHLAEGLGLTFDEYWRLALEDVVKHYHNCIAIEKTDLLSPDQFRGLVELAGTFGVKLMPMYTFPLGQSEAKIDAFIKTHIVPYKDSQNVFAWHIYVPPIERNFDDILRIKGRIERADPNHPVAFLTEYPNAFPLFSRHFPVSGVAHYASHAPWSVANMVHEHLPLTDDGRFWLVAPGFVSPSDTPDWNGCPEMRLMLNLAFACGVKGWFSYMYHGEWPWVSGSCQRSLTGPSLTFSDLWAELGERIRIITALRPLFLSMRPEPKLHRWFNSTSSRHMLSVLPDQVPPTSVYRLKNAECSVYYVVSNDLTEMASEDIAISTKDTKGLRFYDLTEFVQTRTWTLMPRTRHLQMFPGQAHVILAGKPAVCTRWRDIIAAEMVAEDRRQLQIDLQLSRQYGIDLSRIEALLATVGTDGIMNDLDVMKRAQENLLDLMYATPALCEARSSLIETSAALGGCDMALCALLGRGKVARAKELGERIQPLARELAHLRLEFRRGRGAQIRPACEALAKQSIAALFDLQKGQSEGAAPVNGQ